MVLTRFDPNNYLVLLIQTNILVTMQKLILASLLTAAAAFAPASQSGKAILERFD